MLAASRPYPIHIESRLASRIAPDCNSIEFSEVSGLRPNSNLNTPGMLASLLFPITTTTTTYSDNSIWNIQDETCFVDLLSACDLVSAICQLNSMKPELRSQISPLHITSKLQHAVEETPALVNHLGFDTRLWTFESMMRETLLSFLPVTNSNISAVDHIKDQSKVETVEIDIISQSALFDLKKDILVEHGNETALHNGGIRARRYKPAPPPVLPLHLGTMPSNQLFGEQKTINNEVALLASTFITSNHLLVPRPPTEVRYITL